jgi:benzoate 4-monooxygenase
VERSREDTKTAIFLPSSVCSNVEPKPGRNDITIIVDRFPTTTQPSPTMSLTTYLLTPYTLLLLPFLYYLLPYLRAAQIRDIPSPFPSAWTNLWLLYQCRTGKRYLAVHNAHAKYGKLVRLQPHHVSVADADAIPQIYGHGNGFLKSEYYDAFVSIKRGLFNTRDRAEHTRKRKTVAHTFSAKSVGQFEQYIHGNLEMLQRQWDIRADQEKGGWYQMDALHW